MVKVSSKLSKLHLWFPNIFQYIGGIQIYSFFLFKALQELYPDCQYDIFLKHDTCSQAKLHLLSLTRFHCAGTFPLSLRTPAFAAQLLGYGLYQQPDLIISTHINFTPAAALLQRVSGIPYWAVAHGVDAWAIEHPARQQALKQADRILAVSQYTRDRLLQEQNLLPDRVLLLPTTFDPDRFQIASKPDFLLQRYHLVSDQPILLTVARLDSRERYKGYDVILEGLPRILKEIPNVHYLLVGKGPDRDRIEQKIIQLGLSQHVTLTGFVADEELSAHYNLCDVFVLPSKTEGFGIVYLEALACGKPVIAGNRDGAVDALCGGQLGVLVNPEDLDQIVGSIIQVLQRQYSHPILYQPEVLRQQVVSTFGFESFKQKVASLMQCFEVKR